jgi:hypothetical protein
MKWKLMKGKWRPRLQGFVDSLEDGAVTAASQKAFAQMAENNFLGALQSLCNLKGIGPATATAVLAAYDATVPFMSDEALLDVVGTCTYTPEDACTLRDELQGVCTRLNASTRFSDGSCWTPQRAQLAIWAAATGALLRGAAPPTPMAPTPSGAVNRTYATGKRRGTTSADAASPIPSKSARTTDQTSAGAGSTA